MNTRDQEVRTRKAKALSIIAGFAALTMSLTVGTADTQDHVVIVRQAQSLEQLIESELQSNRFAKQIATYNGFDAISTILPRGTALQIPKPYMQQREFGRVVFAKGDVVHTQQTLVVNPPRKGAFVYNGDSFTTGPDGFVSLSFSTGTVVNLQPESRVSIADIECADETVKCIIALSAEKGEVQSEITPRPDGQPPVSFSVTTPFLSAAVRGTAFYVNVEQGADKIGVTRGLVATDSGGNANDLPKGKGLLAKEGAAPSVVDLLAPPELYIGSEKTILSAEDDLHWNDLQHAQQYRVVVASDESMSQPVVVSAVQDTEYAIPEIEPGSYYLAVAGLDEKKFLGLPSSFRFSYATIDDDSRLELNIERRGRSVSIASPDHSGEIQLLLSNSIDSDVVEHRFIDDLSSGLSVDLDPHQDWVIQARKVFSDTSVSAYSNQYLLEALNNID